MRLLAKIAQRRPADLLLAAEALVLLIFFRICLAVVPVRRIIGAIAHGRSEATPGEAMAASEKEMTAARRVQWAVRAVARHSPVEFVCFPQTLAAYILLRWGGLASTIVYGVARSPRGELLAHTWLQMGDGVVIGGEESQGYAPIQRWK